MKRKLIYKDFVENLTGEYRSAFDQIELYLTTEIDDLDKRYELLNDLIELFLTAQDNEKPIEKLIGNNLLKFCNELVEAVSPHKHIVTILKTSILVVSFAFVFLLIRRYASNEDQILYVNIIPFISGSLVGLMYDVIAKKITKYFMFRIKGYNFKTYRILSITVFIMLTVISFLVTRSESMAVMLEAKDLLIGCGIYVVTGIMFFMFFLKKTDKKSKKCQASGKISFRDDVHNKTIFYYRKRLLKKDKIFAKKNGRLMNEEEIESWLDKHIKNYKIQWWIGLVILIIFYTGILVDVLLTSSLGSVIFFGVLLCCFGIIPMTFIFYYGAKSRFSLISELKDNNLSLFDEDLLHY